MPDAVTSTPPATPPQTPAESPQLFAGKYQNFEAFEKGILEARKAIGLPELPSGTKLIGQDGFYSDVRAAEIGYKDLSAMMRVKGQQATPPDPNDPKLRIDPQQPTPQEVQVGVEHVLQKAGVAMESLEESWGKNQKLSDEQYAAIASVNPGYTRDLVDLMMKGHMAQVVVAEQLSRQAATRAAELAGGQEQLTALFDWAKTNLSAAEIERYNQRLSDPREYEDAVLALGERHRRAVGAEGSAPLAGQTVANPSTSRGFTATSDPAEFFAVLRAAQAGDTAAQRRVMDTPADVMSKLSMGL